MRLAWLFLDLRGVEERCNNRSGANANRDACFDQLVAALLVRDVEIVLPVRHAAVSMASVAHWKAG